ncbi:SUMF1/EgtB/PvdO family nonheme iron enzyme [Jhaorihella thermophila]
MIVGQWRALHGDCLDPNRRDRVAKGGLSWFDAVDAARRYSEWLLNHARDRLPSSDGQPGFVRLPTEEEWEFAARGGARVDAARFAEKGVFRRRRNARPRALSGAGVRARAAGGRWACAGPIRWGSMTSTAMPRNWCSAPFG